MSEPKEYEIKQAQLRRRMRLMGLALLSVVVGVGALVGYQAWKAFLDPAGRFAWQASRERGKRLQVLRAEGDRAVVVCDDALQVVSCRDGALVASFGLDLPEPSADSGAFLWSLGGGGERRAGLMPVVLWGDRAAVLREGSVTVFDLAGSKLGAVDWGEGQLQTATPSPDGAVFYAAVRYPADPEAWQAAAARMAEIETKHKHNPEGMGSRTVKECMELERELNRLVTHLVCVEVDGGKERWRRKLKESMQISRPAATTDALFVLIHRPAEADAEGGAAQPEAHWQTPQRIQLMALKAADGKPAIKQPVDLPGQPAWGPEVRENIVLFTLGGRLHALSAKGERLYAIDDVETLSEWGQPVVVDQGSIVVSRGDGSCQAFDLAAGTELWHSRHPLEVAGIRMTDSLVLLQGTIEEKRDLPAGGKLPPAYQEVLDEMQVDAQPAVQAAQTKSVPVLAALERRDGSLRWVKRNVYGEPYTDGDRILIVADTAETSMLNAAMGGTGETIIWQVNPANGKDMYMRRHPEGFAPAEVAGTMLIGLLFDRERRPGILDEMGLQAGFERDYLGIAGVRVK